MTRNPILSPLLLILIAMFPVSGVAQSFDPDLSEQPATHPPLSPSDGEVVSVNPPPMIWRFDERAASYTLELSREEDFSDSTVRVEGLEMPYYNHDRELEEGDWYWRHFVTDRSGRVSNPSPARRFVIPPDAVRLPVPSIESILAGMPSHPRIFTTPDGLDSFRQLRHGSAADAWEHVQWQAGRDIGLEPALPTGLISLRERQPAGPTPGMEGVWQEGEPVRRQVIWLTDGEPRWTPDYIGTDLNADAGRVNVLSFAYLISGEERYAVAARRWLMHIVQARIDYHLEDRAHHDTVVYNYENGLKYVALAFDRLYHRLTSEEREQVLDHIEYHGEAAYEWIRDGVAIHLDYQQSHPQQCMHALLTTTLAVATHREAFREWAGYLIGQYVNRIAWTSEDGGYFEGQTYAHKFRWILEGLVALRTSTGLDLFSKPRIHNSGRFWLYAMSLNYWFHHGGDVYSLLWPWGNSADAYITNLMASMNEDPYLQWWSDTVFADPEHLPFRYLSGTPLEAKPPVDLPQAQLFPDTGQLAAFHRLYDHQSDRIFFRSSRWGSHSHAHADQNSFVIHSGGEIMAADPGYYTYYEDDYHTLWSSATFTHNTLLVNGQGQPPGIDARGEITAYFHSPRYTLFSGDASQAYEAPLRRYLRTVLYIRPGLYLSFDKLEADEPASFTWLLNLFQEAEIQSDERKLTARQQDRRMTVRHLEPAGIRYSQSNERQYPFHTRAWSRFTEAFPEPWLVRAETERSRQENGFLALMSTYNQSDGDPVTQVERLADENSAGVRFRLGEQEQTVLMRRKRDSNGLISGNSLSADGHAAAMLRGPDGGLIDWMAREASMAETGPVRLLEAERKTDIAVRMRGPAADLMVTISGEPQRILVHAGGVEPIRAVIRPTDETGVEMPATVVRDGEMLSIDWPGGSGSLLVNPRRLLAELPTTLPLELTDSQGAQQLELTLSVAEDGRVVAHTELDPRETGQYRFQTGPAGDPDTGSMGSGGDLQGHGRGGRTSSYGQRTIYPPRSGRTAGNGAWQAGRKPQGPNRQSVEERRV